MTKRPELLCPAGGRDALIAAVQNGADAVYLGAGSFNARQSADNFDGDALTEAIRYCHLRGVRVYLTLNTMVREDEFPALEDSIRAIAQAGADAVLVQDFGVARAVRAIAPDLALHASTQMAVHNRAGAEFLKAQGFSRVVLAREMSLDEIRGCARAGVELEVFVHGALCVACSGQCLLSSMVGGRSGNRGRCAQPCRLPYRMNGREGCLLSTRDLCALNLLDELRDAGVDSFKIEGRLKRPEYVAAVAAAYRRAIDHPAQPRDEAPLKQMFNRGGFTTGYLSGLDDAALMYAERPNHLGVAVGECVRAGWIQADAALSIDDALVLRGAKNAERPVKLSASAGERVSCPEARPGDRLIRLVSAAQMRAAQESCEGEHRAAPVDAFLTLRVGRPAELTVSDGAHTAAVSGETVAPARSRGADFGRIEAQLRKTGGTAYRMERVQIDGDENAFCPVSALNALRRDALEQLDEKRLPPPANLRPAPKFEKEAHAFPAAPEIYVQSGDTALLKAALSMGADGAIFAPRDLRPGALSDAEKQLPGRFALAIPMVLSQRTLETLNGWANALSNRIDATYLSNVADFAFPWPGILKGDAALNAASNAAVLQLRQWGCAALTPSLELTSGQIDALGGGRELIVQGRIPLMQLRHCPYRAVHGLKGRHADCRRCDACAPSERLDGRALTDRTGAEFPLRRRASDDGCVVELMNSVPLNTLRRIRRLPKADAWRLLIDDADELKILLPLYRAAARGEDPRMLPEWSAIEKMDTTTGHYFRGVE